MAVGADVAVADDGIEVVVGSIFPQAVTRTRAMTPAATMQELTPETTPVMVHELLDSEADERLIELTREAVEAFVAGDLEASARAWRRMNEVIGPTRLARFYLQAIDDPQLVVDGALRLREK